MLQASIDIYRKAITTHSDARMLFDRGIIDTLCYIEKIPLPNNFNEMISKYRYNTKVFILPPWKEIYQTDSERKQNWQQAEFTFHQMKQTYQKYGYELVQVPAADIETRVKFLLGQIQQTESGQAYSSQLINVFKKKTAVITKLKITIAWRNLTASILPI